jgi:flagellar biosynthesis/type III secretory pathway M-ring protein FliF/YscJ
VTPKPSPPPPETWFEQALKSKYLPVAAGAGVAVLLALFFLVFKVARRGTAGGVPPEMSPQLPAGSAPEDFGRKLENQLAEQAALRQKQEADALNALKLPAVTKKTEVLTKHIGEQAKKDSTAMAHVLRSWMSDGKTT